jgi:hypothetical protein
MFILYKNQDSRWWVMMMQAVVKIGDEEWFEELMNVVLVQDEHRTQATIWRRSEDANASRVMMQAAATTSATSLRSESRAERCWKQEKADCWWMMLVQEAAPVLIFLLLIMIPWHSLSSSSSSYYYYSVLHTHTWSSVPPWDKVTTHSHNQ